MIPETESTTLTDQELFIFSSGQLPEKQQQVCRVFYNNINGLEINGLVETEVRNTQRKKNEQIQTSIEEFTKVEAFFKQMYKWNVSISAIAEHCVDWNESVPRMLLKKIGKNIITEGCGMSPLAK